GGWAKPELLLCWPAGSQRRLRDGPTLFAYRAHLAAEAARAVARRSRPRAGGPTPAGGWEGGAATPYQRVAAAMAAADAGAATMAPAMAAAAAIAKATVLPVTAGGQEGETAGSAVVKAAIDETGAEVVAASSSGGGGGGAALSAAPATTVARRSLAAIEGDKAWRDRSAPVLAQSRATLRMLKALVESDN
ncbi:unnamed protein product, partial [Phaeothamnion confervicola]